MVPQLVQGLVNKFLTQPSYMQGVTDVVTMLKTKRKLPRDSDYRSAYSEPYHAIRARNSGRTSYVSSGHFSLCFEHRAEDGTSYAVKVSLRHDDGAVPYYKWLWENKKWLDSEHYPELFFFGKVAGYDVCVMEWLPDGYELGDGEYWACTGKSSEIDYMTDHLASLLEVGEELAQFGDRHNLGLDIHSENMRCRYDGTVVFSDPFGFVRRARH